MKYTGASTHGATHLLPYWMDYCWRPAVRQKHDIKSLTRMASLGMTPK